MKQHYAAPRLLSRGGVLPVYTIPCINVSLSLGRRTTPFFSPPSLRTHSAICISVTQRQGERGFSSLALLVPLTGLEPVRYRYRGILSPLRLPIPPQRLICPSLVVAASRLPSQTPNPALFAAPEFVRKRAVVSPCANVFIISNHTENVKHVLKCRPHARASFGAVSARSFCPFDFPA